MTEVTHIRKGTLYLIPTALTDPLVADRVLPREVIVQTLSLNHFIAENAKTARAFLKAIGVERPLAEINIVELDKHADKATDRRAAASLLAPLLTGNDVGLVSEAGAPAVADPGADVVALAHQAGIHVAPLVGPSSLLLGLMASGLNGQRFAFHGYLPTDKAARFKVIIELERESRQRNMTQLFIETPYRNQALLNDLLATLAPTTRLCVASDLTGIGESVVMQTVAQWRQKNTTLEKQPTLFLFLA
jgi:16S rRNA (cytidine1402-2'-O)-methyltransferase